MGERRVTAVTDGKQTDMKRPALTFAFLVPFLLLGFHAGGIPGPGGPQGNRAQALRLKKQGNYKDAYNLFRKLALRKDGDPKEEAENFADGIWCLRRLGWWKEEDEFRELVVSGHPVNWRVLTVAARTIFQGVHYGALIAGEFERGPHRGRAKFVNSYERDRVLALRWLVRAFGPAAHSKDRKAVADMYYLLARVLIGQRGYSESWRLQYLTDLEKLPDYEPGYYYPRFGESPAGAPVGPDGKPVFYHVPSSWGAAANDGERWRWALVQAMEYDPAGGTKAKRLLADFLRNQFGVQTLAGYPRLFRGGAGGKEPPPTFQLHTLAEDETLAKLATGVARFKLPPDQNFIRIYKEIRAWRDLAAIFENRRQYDKAAQYWAKAGEWKKVLQIKGNWGRFEGIPTQPAGRGATFSFLFRNGKKVHFTARAVDVAKLLADVKAFLKSNPKHLDWQMLNVGNLGWDLVKGKHKKYVGKVVASWDLDLEPRPGHFDRRITVTTPLQKAGAYLVTAKMEKGNTTRAVVWVADTVVVRKPMDGAQLYFVADAVTGAPVAGANLDLFGYRQVWVRNRNDRGGHYEVYTRQFTAVTGPDGLAKVDAGSLDRRYSWLVTATTPSGRLAYLGFSGIWTTRWKPGTYRRSRTYGITDRPVYRPGQEVKFKFWIEQARYDAEGDSPFAGRSFALRLRGPRGKKIWEKVFQADRYGGFDGKFPLPKDATLGVYYLQVLSRPYGGVSFRVEEYKKPEFEVKVEAPSEPVMLGEKIQAKVSARYYFGAPVTKARVKYKVLRSSYSGSWYPATRWDWLYGRGYWWFSYDYTWYPGWERWGCMRPLPWWWSRGSSRPEVVAQGEAPIGKDGTLSITIDTALAKAIHGDTDHRYSITAEVTDQSRRTIVGTGAVLVARRPFKVFAWLDRGHYRVGDAIRAEFAARRLDGKGVKGKGEARLLRITYPKGKKPVETLVRKWELRTGEDGRASLKLQASQAGQYRLSLTLTDAKGHVEEGGYVFLVTGPGFDGRDFRFDRIELVTDKKTYRPGEEVNLLVNTERPGSTVLLFLRPVGGVYLAPKVLRLKGKSDLQKIAVAKGDMPNFFVEALTVSDGRVYTEVRQIAVPPESRVLNVKVLPSKKEYKPGAPAKVKVLVTDATGEPVRGSVALTMYDKAVEYISGGSNVPDIQAFFWKWKRSHSPRTWHSLSRWGGDLPEKEGMAFLGVFGWSVANEELARDSVKGRVYRGPGSKKLEGALGMPSRRAMKSKMRAGRPATPGSPPTGAPSEESVDRGFAGGSGERGAQGGRPARVVPKVRKKFADTAFWVGFLETAKDGTAEVSLTMPENLTTWKTRAWVMGPGARCGEGTVEVVTTKKFLLRLQAPRFFVQKDLVMLTANIHNYLKSAKQVTAVLELAGGTLVPAEGEKLEKRLQVASMGEERVNWMVRVVKPGKAVVRMKALTDEESDAMETTFPVLVHGMLKTVSYSGAIRPDKSGAVIEMTVPAERLPEKSRLEARWSPTLAGAMVDALPYLASYPYGCTEQTLNRFLPTVITQKVLLRMGLDLSEIRKKRTNLNAQEIGNDKKRAEGWKRWRGNPVFDEKTVKDMVKAGLERLASMQCSDGGWGWFSGWGEYSWPHTTALVVRGLLVARENDVAVPDSMLSRGIAWLEAYQAKQVRRILNGRKDPKVRPWKSHPDNLDALVFTVLAHAGKVNKEMLSFLYEDRNFLSVYAKAMLGYACHEIGETAKRDMLLRNVEQYLKQDDENQTAWLELPNQGYWWFWYGSEFEAEAWYLKLLSAARPGDRVASRLVKYLLNNRKHATYWNSTRDTALCVEAFADYLKATGEMKPELAVQVKLDGKVVKEVKIDSKNLFSFDNKLVVEGKALTSGKHTLEFVKKGKGPLYFNAYLTYFTLEDPITAAGLEIKVHRNYFKLVPVEKKVKAAGSRGQAVDQKVEKFERVPLKDGDTVKSGDVVLVELTIESKNDYEYIVFEDMKPAGFEPVALRSGYGGNEMGAYMELRDEKVVFFLRTLARGRHSMSYKLRAEIPGYFHALPAEGSAMYAPELRANSNEWRVTVRDR